MVNGLYIGATSEAAGKTMLSVGLGLLLKKEGINFGYMRPVGSVLEKREDAECNVDSIFLQELFGFNEPSELVSPIVLTQDFKAETLSDGHTDLLPKIHQAYEKLSQGKDLMLLGGTGSWFTGKSCGLDSISIIKNLGLKAIIVDRISTSGANNDAILTIKERLGDQMVGVILNDIPTSFLSEVTNVIKPSLEKKGLHVLGTVQRDHVLRSIEVNDLVESLGGKLITAQNHKNRRIENFLIGTMQVENFMTYFKREPNSAVIVGWDRADVQLVAIEGECPCIVITGNLFPNDIILSRADTMGVPIIMVRSDTYSVAKKMDHLLMTNKLRNKEKAKQAASLVASFLDFPRIKSLLGI